MAVYDWIGRRMELVGWSGWIALARAANITRRELEDLREVDDLVVLGAGKPAKLARCLGCTVKQLRRLDAGDLEDVPVAKGFIPPPPDFVDSADWPPAPVPMTPRLGFVTQSGAVELDERDGIPREYGAAGTCFALDIGQRSAIFRIVGRQRFRDGADMAVYIADEFEGVGLFGRATIVADKVYLRLPTQELCPIDTKRVARLAKVIDSWPPALGQLLA